MSGLFRSQRATPAPAESTPLQRAFAQAVGFVLPGSSGRLDDAAIEAIAAHEASFGEVHVPAGGIPRGAAAPLLRPALERLKEWTAARSRFDTELEPKRAELNAEAVVEDELHRLRAEYQQKRAHEESVWRANDGNGRILAKHDEADARLTHIRLSHANAAPVMRAYHPLYFLCLFLIGGAEWLINYDIFLMFTGIPAIAVGATLLLGVALAFAAHAHGEIIRQASYRFDRARTRSERAGSWRLLALATVALLIVLGTAGGSRYAAVQRILSNQTTIILGREAMIDANPIRDVAISLLANFAAWLVGVFIAFYCHDPDPDFMRAQHQYNRAERALRQARKPLDEEIARIEAEGTKAGEDAKRRARNRVDSVSDEAGMLKQVERHQQGLVTALSDDARANAERFRDAVCRSVQRGEVRLVREEDGAALSPAAWRAMRLEVEAALSEGLA